MKILAIVVTYKGKQWYDNCFSSLLHSTVPVDIFVVDNASGDGTVEYIREKYPMINLIESNVNLGFGQANNKGFRYALDNGYDYVFLLNQDAWLYSSDCIERLVEVAEKPEYRKYMVLSALWLYGKADRITKPTEIQIVEMAQREADFMSDLFFQRPLLPVYPISYKGAAAWLLSCQVLQTIGGFDPLFFHRGEDDNYMQRINYHGGMIGLCPSAIICHDIEDRPADYDAEHENWEKNLLVELADINDIRTMEQWCSFYLMRSLLWIIRGNWKGAKQNWNIYRFVFSKAQLIQQSKIQNKKKGLNWL